ncbi:MAG: AbrB family transcriptional regulator [Sphingopyxis sp.]|nr:MAG: AbrB family transcriptional regulator [Sphingopyxis sp.]
MSESVRTIVRCQDPGDHTGDVIVELPPNLLAGMEVGLGDSLTIELIDGAIVLRPISYGETKS